MPGDVNCDPACQKIIINGRLMAPTGKRLLAKCAHGSPLYKAAKCLIEASEYASDIVRILTESGALVRSGALGWNGCPQASVIAKWAAGSLAEIPGDAVSKMEAWARDLYAQADALIKGAH